MYSNRSLVRDREVRFSSTQLEYRFIDASARKAGLSISAYLRGAALQGFVPQVKTLPPEVLAFRGQLLHLAGLLQPLARKRVNGDELNALERAELQQTRMSIDDLLAQIQKHIS